MAKEKGLKHKEILKCIRCREDKQKCVPFPRAWPGTKCNRCDEHGYQCSQPLSARNEKIIRETDAKEEISGHSSVSSDDVDFMIDNEATVLVTQSPVSAHAYTITTARHSPSTIRLDFYDANNTMLVETAMPMELSFYRPRDETSGRLMQRLLRFWATPSTYDSICNIALTHTICSFFQQETQRISLLDDMVHNAVLAFTSGDATLNQVAVNSQAFQNLTHSYATKATAMLKLRMTRSWPYLNDATIITAAFHLLLYGVCVSDANILRDMALIMQKYHEHNTGFPLSAFFWAYDDGGWTIRVYQTADEHEPGLIMHNHTNTFERQRFAFDSQGAGGSAPSFATVTAI